MFKNKKLLLVCHDEHTYAMYYIAKQLMASNDVYAVFCGYSETYEPEHEMNRGTYYAMVKLIGKERVYTQNAILDTWRQEWPNLNVDYNYLQTIEKKYTHFKGFRLQLLCGQNVSRNFHNRQYFTYSTYEQDCYLLELTYKFVLNMMEEISPDFILDNEDESMLRAVVNEVAYDKRIPYLSISDTRFNDYVIPKSGPDEGNMGYFMKRYEEYVSDMREVTEGYEKLTEYRRRTNIAESKFIGTTTAQISPLSFVNYMKQIYGLTRYSMDLSSKENHYEKKLQNTIFFFGTPYKFWKNSIRNLQTRQKLFQRNKYFKKPVEQETYVYMPLHLIPESTTFVQAPMWIDELALIKNISKVLPVTWNLYVKEHPAMLGERALEFYEEVNRLTNVKMVRLDYYQTSKEWIQNAVGVITINGSTAFEAVMLGKRAMMFGETSFGMLDGITKISDINLLPAAIAQLEKPVENSKSCAAYIQTVLDYGEQLDMMGRAMNMRKSIISGDELDEKSKVVITKLLRIYDKAQELINY